MFSKLSREFKKFKELSGKNPRFPLEKSIFLDEAASLTDFDRHYIYHPAWAARVIAKTKPAKHVDIASSLHFCSIVSAFVPVEFYDIRPAHLDLSSLATGKADLTKLPFPDQSIASLSCMHSVEHVGLGRYGDSIDPEGDIRAISELKRVLAPGGNLLFVVPVGKPRVVFNAHRIYSYDQILSYFNTLTLQEFALVTDGGRFTYHASKELADKQSYGCGCFWLTKSR